MTANNDDTENHLVRPKNLRTEVLDEILIEAESSLDARIEFEEEYEGYEARLRTESGGTAYETVFATSKEEARETAFELELKYLEVIDIEQYAADYTIEATKEREHYA